MTAQRTKTEESTSPTDECACEDCRQARAQLRSHADKVVVTMAASLADPVVARHSVQQHLGDDARSTPMSTKNELAMPPAIQLYLNALADPTQLADRERIDEIERRLDSPHLTPAERIDLLMQRRAAEAVDIRPLEQAFVHEVPEYLAAYGLDWEQVREDFRTVGVPVEVLERVTLRQSGHIGGGISVEQVQAHVLGRDGEFTRSTVMETTGASRSTVEKALKALVDEGRIERRGARPIIYRLP